jgi:hypothetical protein
MWGAFAEHRSVSFVINTSILANRLKILFAFMTTPIHASLGGSLLPLDAWP